MVSDSALMVITSIIGIVALELYAMSQGIDGMLLTFTIGLIVFLASNREKSKLILEGLGKWLK